MSGEGQLFEAWRERRYKKNLTIKGKPRKESAIIGNLVHRNLILDKIQFNTKNKSMISLRDIRKVLLEAKQEFPHRPMQEKLAWYQRYATIMEEWFEKWFGVV